MPAVWTTSVARSNVRSSGPCDDVGVLHARLRHGGHRPPDDAAPNRETLRVQAIPQAPVPHPGPEVAPRREQSGCRGPGAEGRQRTARAEGHGDRRRRDAQQNRQRHRGGTDSSGDPRCRDGVADPGNGIGRRRPPAREPPPRAVRTDALHRRTPLHPMESRRRVLLSRRGTSCGRISGTRRRSPCPMGRSAGWRRGRPAGDSVPGPGRATPPP